MAAVAITRRLGGAGPWKRDVPQPNVPKPPVRKAHPKSFLLSSTGVKFVFPYAPLPVDTDGYAGVWAQNGRPGRKPLLQKSGLQLRSMSYTVKLYQAGNPLHNMIEALKRLVGAGEPVTFSYGSTESGVYQITEFTLKVLARQFGTNQPTEADATFTLTEQSLASLTLGPLTGGLPAVSVITAATGGGLGTGTVKPTAPSGPHVMIRPAESVADFALRTTGTPVNWKAILDYNHITDRLKWTAGKVIYLPPGLPNHLTGSADNQYEQNARARREADTWLAAPTQQGRMPPGHGIPIGI